MNVPPEFTTWWEKEGRFVRAGGGQYEISFAFEAWQQSRREALEEAADLCDQLWNRYGDADECADAIRALSQHKKGEP